MDSITINTAWLFSSIDEIIDLEYREEKRKDDRKDTIPPCNDPSGSSTKHTK